MGVDLAETAFCCQTLTNLAFIFGVLQKRLRPFLVGHCLLEADVPRFQEPEYVVARQLTDYQCLIHHVLQPAIV